MTSSKSDLGVFLLSFIFVDTGLSDACVSGKDHCTSVWPFATLLKFREMILCAQMTVYTYISAVQIYKSVLGLEWLRVQLSTLGIPLHVFFLLKALPQDKGMPIWMIIILKIAIIQHNKFYVWSKFCQIIILNNKGNTIILSLFLQQKACHPKLDSTLYSSSVLIKNPMSYIGFVTQTDLEGPSYGK